MLPCPWLMHTCIKLQYQLAQSGPSQLTWQHAWCLVIGTQNSTAIRLGIIASPQSMHGFPAAAPPGPLLIPVPALTRSAWHAEPGSSRTTRATASGRPRPSEAPGQLPCRMPQGPPKPPAPPSSQTGRAPVSPQPGQPAPPPQTSPSAAAPAQQTPPAAGRRWQTCDPF